MTRIPPRSPTDPSLRLDRSEVSQAGASALAARFKTWQNGKDAATEARFKDWVRQAEPAVAQFLFAE